MKEAPGPPMIIHASLVRSLEGWVKNVVGESEAAIKEAIEAPAIDAHRHGVELFEDIVNDGYNARFLGVARLENPYTTVSDIAAMLGIEVIDNDQPLYFSGAAPAEAASSLMKDINAGVCDLGVIATHDAIQSIKLLHDRPYLQSLLGIHDGRKPIDLYEEFAGFLINRLAMTKSDFWRYANASAKNSKRAYIEQFGVNPKRQPYKKRMKTITKRKLFRFGDCARVNVDSSGFIVVASPEIVKEYNIKTRTGLLGSHHIANYSRNPYKFLHYGHLEKAGNLAFEQAGINFKGLYREFNPSRRVLFDPYSAWPSQEAVSCRLLITDHRDDLFELATSTKYLLTLAGNFGDLASPWNGHGVEMICMAHDRIQDHGTDLVTWVGNGGASKKQGVVVMGDPNMPELEQKEFQYVRPDRIDAGIPFESPRSIS